MMDTLALKKKKEKEIFISSRVISKHHLHFSRTRRCCGNWKGGGGKGDKARKRASSEAGGSSPLRLKSLLLDRREALLVGPLPSKEKLIWRAEY